MKILVAEDSIFMQKIFIKNLKENGFHHVDIVNNGNEGIEKLKENKYALVISDWNMPKKNGLELLKWMRQNEEYREIPFIMATAQGDKEKQSESKEAGVNGHITKPFTAQELSAAINEAFGIQTQKSMRAESNSTSGKVKINISHLQITDHLVLGILKHQIETGQVQPRYFELNTICNASWNPVQTDLVNGKIDESLVLAPFSMDLFAYNVPIRLISLAHKNGSIFVRSKDNKPDEMKDFFSDKIINIPHKMSVHNMLIHKYLTDMGLKPGVPGHDEINVTLEVVAPIQMPKTLMMSQNIAGFIVAEPIGTNAISKGIAEQVFLSASIWHDHPCCIVVMQESFIQENTDAVYEFVVLLQNAGLYAEANKDEVAAIALDFLDPEKKQGLSLPVLKKVLNEPMGIKINDLYPNIDDFEVLQNYMHHEMGIGKLIDLEKFIDFRFSDEAQKANG
jgi:ABC-type nitrate/sulfonate/bicarbonate transport system substrate-binding protein